MDKLAADRRSENMRRIRSKDTKPEFTVRRTVHKMGFRYRLHQKNLPGKPDLVFSSRRKIIFVHGCFWHGHKKTSCLDGRIPKSRRNYWVPKLTRNRERDEAAVGQLKKDGWRVLVIWECETAEIETLAGRIRRFLQT